MRVVKQSTAPVVTFLMVSSTDHFTGATGLTVTVKLSKNGGAGATSTNAAAAVDAANLPGWYQLILTATETNTVGDIIVRATASGADQADRLLVVESATTSDLNTLATGINAKTTNLPAAPAAVSDIPAAATVAEAVWVAGSRTLSAFGFTVTAATVSDKTGYSLAPTQTCNITGNLIGSVSSVTGAVGSVTGNVGGSVASVTGAVNSVTGAVTLAASQPNYTPAKTGDAMTLTAAYDAAKTAAPTTAQIDTALTATHGSGSWQTGSGGGGGSTGTGSTPVNHDTGGTDALRYLAPGSSPVDGGGIVAFLKSSYDAGNFALPLGSTETRSDGRWKAPLMLDAGVVYTIAFYKQGALSITTIEITP